MNKSERHGSEEAPSDERELLLPKSTVSQSHMSIWSLMLITFVCCLMAAAGSQLMKALSADNLPRSKFVMFTLTAPVIALVLISTARSLWRLLRRNHR